MFLIDRKCLFRRGGPLEGDINIPVSGENSPKRSPGNESVHRYPERYALVASFAERTEKIVSEMTVSFGQKNIQQFCGYIRMKEVFAAKYLPRKIAAGNNRIFQDNRSPLHKELLYHKKPLRKKEEKPEGHIIGGKYKESFFSICS
jgi:hypothetical protein